MSANISDRKREVSEITGEVNGNGVPEEHPLRREQSPIRTTAVQKTGLNLFNDYEVVDGVPTVVISSQGFNSFQRCFFSGDGSRLATVHTTKHISIYDASSDYSLIAQKELPLTYRYVSFWKSCNDKLMVIDWSLQVKLLWISTRKEMASRASTSSEAGSVQEMERILCIIQRSPGIKYSQCLTQVLHDERGMWIVEEERRDSDSILVTRILEDKEPSQINSRINNSPELCFTLVSITEKSFTIPASDQCESKDDPSQKAKVWLNLSANTMAQLVEKSEGVGQADSCVLNEEYCLLSQVDVDKQTILKLHKMGHFLDDEVRNPEPLCTLSLGLDLSNVQVEFLDRGSVPIKKVSTCKETTMPVFAIFVVRFSGCALLIWDTDLNETVREIDLSLMRSGFQHNKKNKYCISPDVKWVGVFYEDCAAIGIFSIVSSTLVWTKDLSTLDTHRSLCQELLFDPLCRSLTFVSPAEVSIFFPSCLCENHHTMDEIFSAEIESKGIKQSLDCLLGHHEFSTRHLLRTMFFECFLEEFNDLLIDVTVLGKSKDLALLLSTVDHLEIHIEEAKDLSIDKLLKRMNELRFQPNEFISFKKQIDKKSIRQSFKDNSVIHMFSYENGGNEFICLFSLENGIHALFMDLHYDLVPDLENDLEEFYDKQCFGIQQCMDNKQVCCITEDGVIKIDMIKKEKLELICYKGNLGNLVQLSFFFTKCTNEDILSEATKSETTIVGKCSIAQKAFGICDVSEDGHSILIGWDTIQEKPFLITSETTQEEIENLATEARNHAPCFAFKRDLNYIAYLETLGGCKDTPKIILYNLKRDISKQHEKAQYSISHKEWLESLSSEKNVRFAVTIDGQTGILWIQMIDLPRGKRSRFTRIALGPYTQKDCIPKLSKLDFKLQIGDIEKLEKYVQQFGISFLNMKFDNLSNFQRAYQSKSYNTLAEFVKIANEERMVLDMLQNDQMNKESGNDLLSRAIENEDDKMVKIVLDMIAKQLISFQASAQTLQENFQDLWGSYRDSFEPLLQKNQLCWTVGEIEVPSDLFNDESYVGARVGLSNGLWEWKNLSWEAWKVWNIKNKTCAKKMKEDKCVTRKLARVKFFCLQDVCKAGCDSILRHLLIQEAPSDVFKTELVKWLITWKWEYVWEKQCRWQMFLYLVFLVVFTTYSICIGYFGIKIHDTRSAKISVTVILILAAGFAWWMLVLEWKQLRTYWEDAADLHITTKSSTVCYYFRSKWNWFELLLYLLFIFIILPLHFVSIASPSILPIHMSFVAIEAICVWIKVWYYAQAFKQTGPLVLMIENMIVDSLPFMLLVSVVLCGFAVAFFVLCKSMPIFSYFDQGTEYQDEEINENLGESFGSLYKAGLTLFFAMIGTFDQEAFSFCGFIYSFITVLFLIYLSIQMIILFNMLISLMGDSVDRVKNFEEQQLLRGRAKIIDACEASLTSAELKEMVLGKYLYVLYPKEESRGSREDQWKGRINKIDEIVNIAIENHEKNILSKLESIEQIRTEMKMLLNELWTEMKKQKDESRTEFLELKKSIQEGSERTLRLT